MVKLCEVVEVAKTFEATTFANQLMKTARNTQQKQVNYTTKSPPLSQWFLVWWKTSTALPSTLPCNEKNNVQNAAIIGHFVRFCKGGTRRQARQQHANFVCEDTKRGSLRYGVRYNPTVCKKTFCESAPKALDKRSRK